MTDKQAEALRLAAILESSPLHTVGADLEAAAELRRLHAENEALKRVIENCKAVSDATAEGWRHDQAKFDTTAALNAELLEALKTAVVHAELRREGAVDMELIRAAIAKAEGKQ